MSQSDVRVRMRSLRRAEVGIFPVGFSEFRVHSVPVNSEVETRKSMKIQVNK